MAIKPVSGEIKSQDINDNLSYLDNKLSQVNGSPSGAFNTVEELNTSFPQGNNNIYIVIENKNWYAWNGTKWEAMGLYLSDGLSVGSVASYMLSDVVQNGNLLDLTTIEDGYIQRDTGLVIGDGGNKTSSFIPIQMGKDKLFFSNGINNIGTVNVAYYNSAGLFLSAEQCTNNKNYSNIPSEAKLFRFSTQTYQMSSLFQVEYDKKTYYKPYETYISSLNSNKMINPKEINLYHLSNIEVGKNKVNTATASMGYIQKGTGEWISGGDTYTTDYVYCEGQRYLTISPLVSNGNLTISWYSEIGYYIGYTRFEIGADTQTTTILKGARFFRLGYPSNMADRIQAEFASSASQFEHYWAISKDLVSKPTVGVKGTYRTPFVDISTQNEFYIYLPLQAQSNQEYLQYVINYFDVPYSKGGNSEFMKLWRICGLNHVKIDKGSIVEMTSITNSGAWETAIQVNGWKDFIGTLHGYEQMYDFSLMIDGVPITMTPGTVVSGNKIQMLHKSKLYKHDVNDTIICDVSRHYTFDYEGLTIHQKLDWQYDMPSIINGYLCMLPILRRVNPEDKNSDLITDTAYCDYDWIRYDVSDEAVFQPINDLIRNKNVRKAYIYGDDSKYSAEVTVDFKGDHMWNFMINNVKNYNKLYFSYGKKSTPKIGDIWLATSNYKFGVNK